MRGDSEGGGVETDCRYRAKGGRSSLLSLPQDAAFSSPALVGIPGNVACMTDSTRARVLKGSRLMLAKTGTQRRPRMKQA